jgi:transposase
MCSAPLIGVDVARQTLEVAVEGAATTTQFTNDVAGRRRLIQRLQHLEPRLVVLEASGGYEEALLERLWAAPLPVIRVNPRPVRDFARASGQLAKTDVLDAHNLVAFGRAMQLQAQTPPSPLRRELAQLQHRRQELVKMRVAEENRLQQTAQPTVQTSIQTLLASLRDQEQALEAAMDALIASDAELLYQARLLRSVPGVGVGTVRLLLGALPELGQLSSKAVAALVGVAPYNRDSGAVRGQRATWGGRAAVRHGLYLAVWTAVKYNPVIRSFYVRLVARGKPKQVAYIACVRKLAVILNAMLRDGVPFQPASMSTASAA